MPRFFDDYGHCYLTHDSAAGRKQQRRGWKFRENFKLYYTEHLPEWRASAAGLAAAQTSHAQRAPDQVPPLPEEFEEKVDDCTGQKYYENTQTGDR